MSNPQKAVLCLFLTLLLLSFSGAGMVSRNQSRRRAEALAVWSLWRTPSFSFENLERDEERMGRFREEAHWEPLSEPEAAERLREDLARTGLVLTSLKRISLPKGVDLYIEAGGPIGGILGFLEILPQSLSGWCFRDLSLRHRSPHYTLELRLGERAGTVPVREKPVFAGLVKPGSADLERQLFSLYPPRKPTAEGSPARLGVSRSYAAPPEWLVLSGFEKTENQRLTYLFLDSRTGRVRRVAPEQTTGDWTLISGSSGWILRVGQEEYFLGGL